MGFRPLKDSGKKYYEDELKVAEARLKTTEIYIAVVKEKLEKGEWNGKGE